MEMDGKEENDTGNAEALPLGWTRVRRRKRVRESEEEDDDNANEIDWCCEDPNCTRAAAPSVGNDPATLSSDTNNASTTTAVKGTAVFCLHDTDPSWFQGYLQVQGQRKPWGLLAIQQTIDECLECKDGGYRQITLKVFAFDSHEPHFLESIEWTGGDMMRLQSAALSMEAHSLWVGKKAVPYVERYFKSLINKLRDSSEDSVLDVVPDVAIVTGPMTLTLPTPNNSNNQKGINQGK